MTRKSAYLQWALLAALVGWVMPASAQFAGSSAVTGVSGSGAVTNGAPAQEDGNINVTMVSAGGQPFSEQARASKPINLKACQDGHIVVTISGATASASYPYLEVWYSTGSGACNQGDRSTRITGSQNCTKLSHDQENKQLSGLTIFNVDVNIEPVCQLNSDETQGLDGPKTLYFLMLQSQGSTETAMFYRAFTIRIDTTPPDPPEITSAGKGETDIELKWNLPVSSLGFWVAADYSQGALGEPRDTTDTDAGPAASGDGACSSNILIGGKDFDPSVKADGYFTHEIGSPTTEYSFNGQDFKGVKSVPVVVVAQDLAGNLSKMSAVKCITVTPTTGFWDRYKQGGGENGGIAEPGCACSVPGTPLTKRPTLVTAVPVALLLAGVLVRRRIRRRAR